MFCNPKTGTLCMLCWWQPYFLVTLEGRGMVGDLYAIYSVLMAAPAFLAIRGRQTLCTGWVGRCRLGGSVLGGEISESSPILLDCLKRER